MCAFRILVAAVVMMTAAGAVRAEPAESTTAQRIDALVRQLGDDKFARRQAAARELEDLGEAAWPALRKASAHRDTEVAEQARRLADAIARGRFVELKRFSGTHYGYWMNRVMFTPDGKQAICTGGGVITYDLETGKEVRRTMELPYGRWGLVLTKNGHRFLTGHQHDRTVRLGDLATGKELQAFEGHTTGVRDVALSPDEKTAASGADDGVVRLWDMKTGKEIKRLEAAGGAFRLTYTPDGRLLVAYFGPGSDNLIRLWGPVGGEEVRQFKGHTGDVTGLAVLPDGRTFLSASRDGTARLWDLESGKELRRLDHPGGIQGLAVSGNGRRAMTAGYGDCVVRLWDLADGSEVFQLNGHQAAALSAAFSPDGRYALTGDARYTVRLWRLPPAPDRARPSRAEARR